tara:strand:- start:667 stop:849 length:183 start_codon:yes stop_codon:yes gene_type:complete
MSIIDIEMRRLDNIARMYHKTSGDIKEMWRKKWYELAKKIGGKINESKTKRLTTDSRQIH